MKTRHPKTHSHGSNEDSDRDDLKLRTGPKYTSAK